MIDGAIPRLFSGILIAAAVALLVVFDPLLSNFVPTRLWETAGIESWPLKLTPVVLSASGYAAQHAKVAFLIALFAAAQMNGLRVGPADVFDVVLLIGILGWTAGLLRGQSDDFVIKPVFWIGLAFLILATAHLMVQSPGRFLVGWIGIFRAVLVAIIITNLIRDRATLDLAIRIFVVVAVISAGIAIVQFLAGYFLRFYFTLLVPPESAFKPTPIGFVMRASGLCITSQHLSSFLLFAFPLAAWRATSSWRAIDLVVVAILGLGVLVTWNTGAILILAAIVAIFPIVRWPHLTVHILLVYGLFLTALFLSGAAEWLYDTAYDAYASVAKGVSQRSTLFSIGLDKLRRNPWVGTGPQGFAEFSGNFWHRPVHHALFQAATEFGLLGALLFLVLQLGLLTALLIAVLRDDKRDASLVRSMLLVQLSLVALMNSEPMLDHSNTWLVIGLIQAAVTIVWRHQ